MKKKNQTIKLLSAIFILCSHLSFSQQYFSSGDISINIFYINSHDVTSCGSTSNAQYNIQISNAQYGDTFKINVPGIWGYNVYTAVNTTGANPWSIITFDNPFFSPDQQLNNQPGNVFFSWEIKKAILTHYNGGQQMQDTLHDIYLFDQLYVEDPCTYQTVSGKAYFDENQNCSYETGDIPLSNIYVGATSNVGGGGGYTNSTGNYTMTLQETNMTSYTVGLPANYQFIFQSTACSPVYYTETTLPQTDFDFSLQCDDIDLYASAGGPGRAMPNDPFRIYGSTGNVGCTPTSGQLKMILDPRVTYTAANSYHPADAVISTVTGDTLVWNFSNLSSLSNGSYWNAFLSRIEVTPSTSVTIGDTLYFSYWSTIPVNDVNTANNQGSFRVVIVAAYDPNFKEVTPQGVEGNGYIEANTQTLTYTVHFQNSGTASASNIYVIDTLDASIDPASLHIELTSHALSPEWLAHNVVKFKFNNIQLPHEAVNEPGSHGQFTFSIRLQNSLPLGTEIKNRAHIYFDYNPAIITNYTTNTLAVPPSVATTAVTGLTNTSVNFTGEVTEEGGAPVIQKGFCWSMNPLPTINDLLTNNSQNTSTFTNSLSGLPEASTYYVRAFATNAMGTSYGEQMSFTTLSTATLPQLELAGLVLYPNPVTSIVTIQATELLKRATIMSTDGKVVGNFDLTDGTMQIDVSSLKSGVYIVEIESFVGFVKRSSFVKK